VGSVVYFWGAGGGGPRFRVSRNLRAGDVGNENFKTVLVVLGCFFAALAHTKLDISFALSEVTTSSAKRAPFQW
jgi:hypothetical protein